MKFIKFKDFCIIRRRNGKDAWDNETYVTVYSGECMYEEAGKSYSSQIFTRRPLLFLPVIENLIAIDDVVTITSETGRSVEASVEVVRDVVLDKMTNIRFTRLELSRAKGD